MRSTPQRTRRKRPRSPPMPRSKIPPMTATIGRKRIGRKSKRWKRRPATPHRQSSTRRNRRSPTLARQSHQWIEKPLVAPAPTGETTPTCQERRHDEFPPHTSEERRVGKEG